MVILFVFICKQSRPICNRVVIHSLVQIEILKNIFGIFNTKPLTSHFLTQAPKLFFKHLQHNKKLNKVVKVTFVFQFKTFTNVNF